MRRGLTITDGPPTVVDELRGVRMLIGHYQKNLDAARRDRERLILEAVDDGVSVKKIARTLGTGTMWIDALVRERDSEQDDS